MNLRLIPATLALLSAGTHQAANAQTVEKEAIPNTAGEPMDLFEGVSEADTDFAYNINFEFRKNVPTKSLPQLQRVLRDWGRSQCRHHTHLHPRLLGPPSHPNQFRTFN
jgi:hypothetical protein